jgi:hypothetical protein
MIRLALRVVLLVAVAWWMARLGHATAHRLHPGAQLVSQAVDSTGYVQEWHFSSAEALQGGKFSGALWEEGRGIVPTAENVAAGAPGVYISPVLTATQPVEALVAQWVTIPEDGEGIHLEVRWQSDEMWSDWEALHIDEDLPGVGSHFSPPLFLPGVTLLQWRVQVDPAYGISSLNLGVLPFPAGATALDLAPKAVPLPDGGPLVIPRSEWGRTLSAPRWEPEPNRPRAFVIHHTATGTGGNDPAAVVRAIDVYHRVTRDWGDIGYHYLIDHEGRIYAGRKGGPESVGAHAYNFNYGTIGIALVGTFERTSITPAARTSLVSLTTWLSRRYGINPESTTNFYDKPFATMMGHRHTGRKTTCPGEKLAEELPQLRRMVAQSLSGVAPLLPPGIQLAPSGEWVSGTITATLTVSDQRPMQVALRLNGQELRVQDRAFQMTIDTTTLADGEHVLQAVARQGNQSVHSDMRIKVDNTPPTIRLSATPTAQGATVIVTDGGSGLAQVSVRRRDGAGKWGEWENLSGTFPTATLESTVPFGQATALHWRAIDRAGNQLQSSVVEPPRGPAPQPPGQGGTVPGMNLAVENLEVFPTQPNAGEQLVIQVVVVNRGDTPVERAFPVDVLIDDAPAVRWLVEAGIPAGAMVLLRSDRDTQPPYFRGWLTAGEHQLVAIVDPPGSDGNGVIVEPDEGVNRFGPVALSVGPRTRPVWDLWWEEFMRRWLGSNSTTP